MIQRNESEAGKTCRAAPRLTGALKTPFAPALAMLITGCAVAGGLEPGTIADPAENGAAHEARNERDARPGDGAGAEQGRDAAMGPDGPIGLHADGYSLAPDAGGAPNIPEPPDASPPIPAPDGAPPTPAPPDGALGDVDRCPGAPLPALASAQVTHTTQGLGNDSSSSAACGPVASGRDAVYRYVAPKSGRVSAVLTPHGYAALLYVRGGGCESGPQLACTNGGILNVPATAVFDVVAGESYYLFADQSLGLTDGWFELALAYQ